MGSKAGIGAASRAVVEREESGTREEFLGWFLDIFAGIGGMNGKK